ncbi:MAG: DUF4136 domain-containing protein [Sphingobacteriales bacterium]|nr:DUF4136 domain-containing protein [Sphingobacteriales bacterium]
MISKLTTAACIFIVVLSTGCGIKSYVQKEPNNDFKKYKTFNWIESVKDFKNVQDNTVRQSITAQLNRKGLKEVKSNADISIDYDLMVSRETAVVSDPVYTTPYVGYRYNPLSRTVSHAWYPSQYIGENTYSVPYKIGTVSINMVDNRDNTLVWQGWAQTEVEQRKMNPNEIDEIVKAILKKYKN